MRNILILSLILLQILVSVIFGNSLDTCTGFKQWGANSLAVKATSPK